MKVTVNRLVTSARITYLWGCRFLHQVDLEKCRTRIAAVERLKGLEAAVAAVLGVAMIYAPPALTMDPRYSVLLQALAAQVFKSFCQGVDPHCVHVAHIHIHLPCFLYVQRACLAFNAACWPLGPPMKVRCL